MPDVLITTKGVEYRTAIMNVTDALFARLQADPDLARDWAESLLDAGVETKHVESTAHVCNIDVVDPVTRDTDSRKYGTLYEADDS